MFQPGDRLEAWRVTRLLDRARWYEVWLAERMDDTGVHAVVRRLRTGAPEVDRDVFARGIEALQRLDHEAFARVVLWRRRGTPPYAVLEPVGRRTLADRNLAGELDETGALHVAHRIALALRHAHQRGVFYWDLRADQVLEGPEGHPRLVGLRPPVPGRELRTRRIDPIPPEGRREGGHVNPISWDIYGLGVLLYELLETADAASADAPTEEFQPHSPPPPRPLRLDPGPAHPPEVRALVGEMTHVSPARRIGSLDEVLRRLGALTEGGGWGPEDPTVVVRAARLVGLGRAVDIEPIPVRAASATPAGPKPPGPAPGTAGPPPVREEPELVLPGAGEGGARGESLPPPGRTLLPEPSAWPPEDDDDLDWRPRRRLGPWVLLVAAVLGAGLFTLRAIDGRRAEDPATGHGPAGGPVAAEAPAAAEPSGPGPSEGASRSEGTAGPAADGAADGRPTGEGDGGAGGEAPSAAEAASPRTRSASSASRQPASASRQPARAAPSRRPSRRPAAPAAAPPSDQGAVALSAAIRSVELVHLDLGTRIRPGPVPAGRYRVVRVELRDGASFVPEGAEFTVAAGRTVTLGCDAATRTCRAR